MSKSISVSHYNLAVHAFNKVQADNVRLVDALQKIAHLPVVDGAVSEVAVTLAKAALSLKKTKLKTASVNNNKRLR